MTLNRKPVARDRCMKIQKRLFPAETVVMIQVHSHAVMVRFMTGFSGENVKESVLIKRIRYVVKDIR